MKKILTPVIICTLLVFCGCPNGDSDVGPASEKEGGEGSGLHEHSADEAEPLLTIKIHNLHDGTSTFSTMPLRVARAEPEVTWEEILEKYGLDDVLNDFEKRADIHGVSQYIALEELGKVVRDIEFTWLGYEKPVGVLEECDGVRATMQMCIGLGLEYHLRQLSPKIVNAPGLDDERRTNIEEALIQFKFFRLYRGGFDLQIWILSDNPDEAALVAVPLAIEEAKHVGLLNPQMPKEEDGEE